MVLDQGTKYKKTHAVIMEECTRMNRWTDRWTNPVLYCIFPKSAIVVWEIMTALLVSYNKADCNVC